MKNATVYEKKIKKLLSSMSRKALPAAPKELEGFTRMIEAILQTDAPRKVAASILAEIHREFIDYNELRVAPMKDITDCMPRDFYAAREKADSLIRSLNTIFDKTSSMSMEYLEKMPKRELRKYLVDEAGLSPYAAAVITLNVFGGHAVPVDQFLVDELENQELIQPGSDLADVQGFLERIIPQKDAWSAHEFFRDFMEKNYKALVKKRKEIAALAPPPPPPAPKPLPLPVPPPLPDLDDDEDMDDVPPAPLGAPDEKNSKKGRPGRGGKPVKPSKPTGRK